MTLEQQVCSLELAKRLKELGVKQESYFVWRSDGGNLWHPHDDVLDYERSMGCVSAFTVAELGEMLPDNCDVYRRYDFQHIAKRWIGRYAMENALTFTMNESEADARATMLIHLIEKKLITLP